VTRPFAQSLLLSAVGLGAAAQVPPVPAYKYEVVSIHAAAPGETSSGFRPGPQGGLNMHNDTALQLLSFAYDAKDYQFVGANGWMLSERFEINMTPDRPDALPDAGMTRGQVEGWLSRNRQRVQAVLLDRFGLVLHMETRELPMYGLSVAPKGPKLSAPADPSKGPSFNINNGRQITARSSSMKMLANALSTVLGRFVRDETGLDGDYDFKVEFAPDVSIQVAGPGAGESASAGDTRPSIFTALKEQLGLRLESKKGPVPVYVIEKMERPGEN